jgi:hypothetical protein
MKQTPEASLPGQPRAAVPTRSVPKPHERDARAYIEFCIPLLSGIFPKWPSG